MSETNTSGERQIEASEVKPGMKVRWEQGGITYECAISSVGPANFGVNVMAQQSVATIYDETPVTVLSEPQPEEPTEFGARVIVSDLQLIRRGVDSICAWEDSTGLSFTWRELLRLGPVQVVPDQGWDIPGNIETASEAPDRIEEWPGNDEHLREHKWCDRDGYRWTWIVADAQWECRDDITDKKTMTAGIPADGPWTRATEEPTPEVSKRIEEWDTWEEVPEGVVVANRKMCYYYRKAGSRVEALSPFNDVVMGGTGLYMENRPGPWTRVTTNTISHEKKENV